MNAVKLVTAAVALCAITALASPALADDGYPLPDISCGIPVNGDCLHRHCRKEANFGLSCISDPTPVAKAPDQDIVVSGFGLTGNELTCVATKDNVPDPIAECHIPDTRVAAAMDFLLSQYNYNARHTSGATWVQAHCEAKPAIPHNKWVCTYNDVTREYR